MADSIELEDYIQSLRASLLKAMAEGEGKALRFSAEEITLELEVAAKRTAEGKAGISFSVFGIGAEMGGGAGLESAQTQKLTLKLKPFDASGKPTPLISDKVVVNN